MSIALKYHPRLYLVFLITLSRNPSDQLEIYDAKQLVQSYYKKNPPYVVGLSGNYEEAVALVARMTEECLNSRGDCCLKEYLQC